MKLAEAYILQAQIMLDGNLMPDVVEGLGPEDLRRRVKEYVGLAIDSLAEGESIEVARQDDERAPWLLTWSQAATN